MRQVFGEPLQPASLVRALVYPAMMGGAHRKLATPISTPAITQHLVYWAPKDVLDKRNDWIGAIEQFVLRLYEHLRDSDLSPRISGADRDGAADPEHVHLLVNSYARTANGWSQSRPINDGSRYQTVRLECYWQTLSIKTRIELHNEYFTLTTLIDLSEWHHREPVDNAKKLIDAIARFDDFCTRRYASVSESHCRTEDAGDRDELSGPYTTIYHTIWNEVHKALYATPFAAVGSSKLNSVLADFRNFVATRDEMRFIHIPKTNVQVPPPLVKRPFQRIEGLDCVETIRPFIAIGAGDPSERTEYTFSGLLHRRCLHVSMLGAEPTALEKDKKPVTDLFLLTHADKWQIGRLIDRADTLGVLRIAALYELEQINDASRHLRQLEENLADIAKQMTYISGKPHDVHWPGLASRLFEITIELTQNWKDKILGGLSYRVDRSRYYHQQFLDLATAQRITRVEGSQPYDEFINRRLGATYEFIRMVGIRYGRVDQRAAALNQQLRSVELVDLNQQIAEQTRLLNRQTDYLNVQTGYLNAQTGVIERLQRGAEILFFLVPFPYYASSYVLHLFSEHTLEELPEIKWAVSALFLAAGIIGASRDRLLETKLWHFIILAVQRSPVLPRYQRYRRYITKRDIRRAILDPWTAFTIEQACIPKIESADEGDMQED